jgi:hypothetical protein
MSIKYYERSAISSIKYPKKEVTTQPRRGGRIQNMVSPFFEYDPPIESESLQKE